MSSTLTALNSSVSSLEPAARTAAEEQRQRAYNDADFYLDYICFFEMIAPLTAAGTSLSSSYLFPLMFSPSQYSITEPYAVEATNTLNGGLFVEQNGVVQRRITIQGHTGLAPHKLNNTPVQNYGLTTPRNYTANPNLQPFCNQILSGQRHFQFLQQTVFRAYSDLKRNPSTAANTTLIFHNPKDDEHFEVVPLAASMSRSAQSPFLYPYSIELLCIGPASPSSLGIAPTDKAWTPPVMSAQGNAKNIYQRLSGAINDLTAVVGDIRIQAKQIVGIIDKATYIVQAVGNFVTGAKGLIDVPLTAVKSLATLIETTMQVYDDARETGSALANFPNAVVQRFRVMQSALEQLAFHPESFDTPLQARVQQLNAALNTRITGQNAVASATSFGAIKAAGTANLPGDADIAQGEADAQQATPGYQSVFAYTVRQGDTMASIASKLLGSPMRYRDIAILNNFQPPFVGTNGVLYASLSDASNAASLLTPGQVLSIPSTQPFASIMPSPVVLGATSDDPIEVQLLGRDLKNVQVGTQGNTPLYDMVVLDNGNTADLVVAEGLDAVQQAVTQQIVQQARTNVLYPDVGIETVVPTGLSQVDQTLLHYRFNAALTRDPRVTGVQSLEVSADATGTVQVNANVQVTGMAGTLGISTG